MEWNEIDPYRCFTLHRIHTAVSLFRAALTPTCSPPDSLQGRPYPYVFPPRFPGAYPTIAFVGTAERKQLEAGLQPLMRIKMWVKYAGIANSPVRERLASKYILDLDLYLDPSPS